MGHPVQRDRQFKMLISNREWEELGAIAEYEDMSASEVLRAFIQRRYQEVTSRPRSDELSDMASSLSDLARRLKAIASTRKAGR